MRKLSVYTFVMLISLLVSFLMAGASSTVGSSLSNQRIETVFHAEDNVAPAVEWNKTYGTTRRSPNTMWTGTSVVQTTDGGFAVASNSDFGTGNEADCRYWLVKTDSTGNTEWNKTYGEQNGGSASIVQTIDGGYALAGYYNIGGYPSAWLAKTDSSGSIQWSKNYTEIGVTIGRALIQTNDGGYVIAGAKGDYDGWLMKTDADGNIQWSSSFVEANNTQLEGVVQTSDGGFIAAGATQFPPFSGKVDAYLVKTDSDGNTTWSKEFSRTTDDDYGRSVVQTSDGGYAIAGETDHFGNADFWLIKTDASGNFLWDKTYGGAGWDGANSIIQTSDAGYILAGQTSSFGAGGNDFWLVETDSTGNIQGNQTYGGAGDDVGQSIVQTADRGYAMCGYTNSFSGDGSYEVWLIKLRGSGPRTWVVDDDGPADFSTIQEAINAASDGDTVFVKAGAYSEPIQINKALTLLGENKSTTFIKDWYIGVYANNVRISNFTIESLWADSPSGAGGCVYIYGFDGLTFSDNIYIHNWQAIRLIQTSGDLIINNYIDGSSQGGTLGGIGFDYVNNTIMRNNTITNCGQALSLSLPNYNNTFFENNFIGNSRGIVMNNLLTGNKFYHNNLINNTEQVYTYHVFQGVDNSWDDGYPSGGNYWSDYIGIDSDGDGIGETPYIIDENNRDNYPLINKRIFFVIPVLPFGAITALLTMFATLGIYKVRARRKVEPATLQRGRTWARATKQKSNC